MAANTDFLSTSICGADFMLPFSAFCTRLKWSELTVGSSKRSATTLSLSFASARCKKSFNYAGHGKSSPKSFLRWGAQYWTQRSKWDLTGNLCNYNCICAFISWASCDAAYHLLAFFIPCHIYMSLFNDLCTPINCYSAHVLNFAVFVTSQIHYSTRLC